MIPSVIFYIVIPLQNLKKANLCTILQCDNLRNIFYVNYAYVTFYVKC